MIEFFLVWWINRRERDKESSPLKVDNQERQQLPPMDVCMCLLGMCVDVGIGVWLRVWERGLSLLSYKHYLEGSLGWRRLNPSFLKCPTICNAVTLDKTKKEDKHLDWLALINISSYTSWWIRGRDKDGKENLHTKKEGI